MSRPAAVAAAAACALLMAGASPAWAVPAPGRDEGRILHARHDHRPVASAPVLDLEAPRLEWEAPNEDVEPPVEPVEDTDGDS